MNSNPETFIARIFGILTFEFKKYGTIITIVVMENIIPFNQDYILRTYDLKGSNYQRQVYKESYSLLDKKSRVDMILKDIDFNEIESTLKLTSIAYDKVHRQISSDVNFFKKS